MWQYETSEWKHVPDGIMDLSEYELLRSTIY